MCPHNSVPVDDAFKLPGKASLGTFNRLMKSEEFLVIVKEGLAVAENTPQIRHTKRIGPTLTRENRPVNIGRDGGIRTHDPLTPSPILDLFHRIARECCALATGCTITT